MQGRLAQMDRVQASEAWGRGFESHAARHFLLRGHVSPFVLVQPSTEPVKPRVTEFPADYPTTAPTAE